MKIRLDIYLVNNNYFLTRNKARLAIENNDIMVNNIVINKPSHLVDENDTITIVKESLPYVSRGGLKLEHALHYFSVNVKDCTCLDIGSSTGGFSDCLLQYGATKVYALDVGTNQLDEKLKSNPNIISIENTNFRTINTDEYANLNINIITADVSFISLTYLFENVSKILKDNGFFIALIKPQFEVNKKEHNKNGVVNDKKIHYKVLQKIIDSANQFNLYINKLTFSPIKGEKSGNIEYLTLISFNGKNINLLDVSAIIDLAFKELR